MPPERTSSGFGGRLRDARERRGVSLRQIANATKISVAVLEALERNDISKLPGGIFGRAFVRSYAIEVGLDPDATIQEFIAQFPNDSVTAGHPASDQVEDHDAVESDRQTAGTFLWLPGDQRAGRGRPAVLRHARPPRSGRTAAGADRRAGIRATSGSGTSTRTGASTGSRTAGGSGGSRRAGCPGGQGHRSGVGCRSTLARRGAGISVRGDVR